MKGVVATASRYDKDGIEIQFLNNKQSGTVKVCSGRCETLEGVV